MGRLGFPMRRTLAQGPRGISDNRQISYELQPVTHSTYSKPGAVRLEVAVVRMKVAVVCMEVAIVRMRVALRHFVVMGGGWTYRKVGNRQARKEGDEAGKW
jgi:hypothetical protein